MEWRDVVVEALQRYSVTVRNMVIEKLKNNSYIYIYIYIDIDIRPYLG